MRLVILAICLLALAGCQTTSPRDTLGGPILLIPDVGQGHGAALVEGDRAVLIDVGPADQDAMDVALRAQGVREIELVVLTHPDIDHVGGLDGLTLPMRGILRGAMSREDSGRVLSRCPIYPNGCRRALPLQEIHVLADLMLRILGPSDTSVAAVTNANSLVVEFRRDGRCLFVASGDLDTLGELALLDRLEPTEVVQLGHHGSRSSSHLRWLGAMMPRYVVVQAGLDNSYGHPAAEALARAEAVGAKILLPVGNCLRVAFLPRAVVLD